MDNTFLGQYYPAASDRERRALAERIRHISDEDRAALFNDLSKMSADTLFYFVEGMTQAQALPHLVTMAIESRPTLTGFNYNNTLSMINLALKTPFDEKFDKAAAVSGVAKLIKGYVHRTNMNLIEGISTSLTKESITLLSGHHEIDEAFVEHLGRALTKKPSFAQTQNIIYGLRDLDIPLSFATFLVTIKEPEQYAIRSNLLNDFYHGNALTPAYIKTIRAELGDDVLINLARLNINEKKAGLTSFNWIVSELTEAVVINQATLDQQLAASIKAKKACDFFSDILAGTKGSGIYEQSATFVLNNLATLIKHEKLAPSESFAYFARDSKRGQELVSVYLDKIASMISGLDDFRDVNPEHRFDAKANTQGAVLSEVFNIRYELPEARDIKTWRNATIRAITTTGVLEFAESLADIHEPAAMAIYKDMGTVANRDEILKKFMKIRQVAFCSDLGM
ncbi:hypothetical protein [Pseudomonas serbica]|jgi:hypothetical protein|uniref:hypothetical protein n=1 Tax=Pseudomonas serbica TaxID=2965074 RepID=UPI00237B5285|nr:hypothetical protein [Pseudomonas serbica]